MKKQTALGICLALSAALLTGFSFNPAETSPQPAGQPVLEFRIDPTAEKTITIDDGVPILYAYGPETAGTLDTTGGQTASVNLKPSRSGYKITRVEATALTDNVSAKAEMNDGTDLDGKTPPTLTLAAKNGPSDCVLGDYRVQLRVTIGRQSGYKVINRRTVTAIVRGQCAYSQSRDLEDDGVYTISPESGSVFQFTEVLLSPARVRPNGQVALSFMGDYIGGSVNLRADDSEIPEVEAKLTNSSAQYCNFIGRPVFSRAVQVSISGPEEAHIYEYNADTGTFTRIATTYERDSHVFSVTKLTCYLLTADIL